MEIKIRSTPKEDKQIRNTLKLLNLHGIEKEWLWSIQIYGSNGNERGWRAAKNIHDLKFVCDLLNIKYTLIE